MNICLRQFVWDFVHLLYNMKALASSDVKASSRGKYVGIALRVALSAGIREHQAHPSAHTSDSGVQTPTCSMGHGETWGDSNCMCVTLSQRFGKITRDYLVPSLALHMNI